MSWGFVRESRGIGWGTLVHVCGSVGRYPMIFLKKHVLYCPPRNIEVHAMSKQASIFYTLLLTYIQYSIQIFRKMCNIFDFGDIDWIER